MLSQKEDRKRFVMIWRKTIPDRKEAQGTGLEVRTNSVDSRSNKNATV